MTRQAPEPLPTCPESGELPLNPQYSIDGYPGHGRYLCTECGAALRPLASGLFPVHPMKHSANTLRKQAALEVLRGRYPLLEVPDPPSTSAELLPEGKRPAENLVGQRFGLLTVVRWDRDRKKPMWLCQCDCGQTTHMNTTRLRRTVTPSCGCARIGWVRRREADSWDAGVRSALEGEPAERIEAELARNPFRQG